MPIRAGPSSRSGGNEKRKTISLGMTMKWSPTLTTDLLELIKSNPDWRHTFFSRDSAKAHQWKDARDVLCLLCRKQEHGLMRRMEHFGLVKNSGRAEGGGIVWKPTDKWNRADVVTNRAESQLRRLRDDYGKMRAEHSIPDTVSTWKDIDKNIRGSLKSLNPFFIAVHNLRKYDDALTSHPLPADLIAGPSRSASSHRQPKVKPVPVKRRASTSSSASSSGSSVVIVEKPAVKRVKTEPRSPSPENKMERKPKIPMAKVPVTKRDFSATKTDRPDMRYHSLEEAMNPALSFNTPARRLSVSSSASSSEGSTSESSEISPNERHESPPEWPISSDHKVDGLSIHEASRHMITEEEEKLPIELVGGDESRSDRQVPGVSNRSTSLLVTWEEVKRIPISDHIIRHRYDLPINVTKWELLQIARIYSGPLPNIRPEIFLGRRLRSLMARFPGRPLDALGLHEKNQIATFFALYGRRCAATEIARILPPRRYSFTAGRSPAAEGLTGPRDTPETSLFYQTAAVLRWMDERRKGSYVKRKPLVIQGLRRIAGSKEVDLGRVATCTLHELWRAIDTLVQSLPIEKQRRMVE